MEYAQYLTEESSKTPEQQQYIQLRFTKPIERETSGDGQVKPTQLTQRNWNPNQKNDIQGWGDKTQKPWSDLNETEPNCR